MNLPIRNVALPIALMTLCVALSGCGNKGPLVKPSAIPAATPAATAPAAEQPAGDAATNEAPETGSGTPAARR